MSRNYQQHPERYPSVSVADSNARYLEWIRTRRPKHENRTIEISGVEADFLMDCLTTWCIGENGERIDTEPSFVDNPGCSDEEVLLTHAQIENLFDRLQDAKFDR